MALIFFRRGHTDVEIDDSLGGENTFTHRLYSRHQRRVGHMYASVR